MTLLNITCCCRSLGRHADYFVTAVLFLFYPKVTPTYGNASGLHLQLNWDFSNKLESRIKVTDDLSFCHAIPWPGLSNSYSFIPSTLSKRGANDSV